MSRPARPRQRSQVIALALVAGLVTHGIFLAAVTCMAASLRGGMNAGIGPFTGRAALLADLVLVLQFPFVHSMLLARRGRRLLVHAVPLGLGRDLSTTTYSACASLQILVTFGLWSPTGVQLWAPGGPWLQAATVLYAGAWLLLGKAMLDAGLGIQMGFLGWTSVLRGKRPDPGTFSRRGLFQRCRQPVYFAFAMILLSGPVWTLDHLLIAAVWVPYCVVGPRFKERRYLVRYGPEFARYQERVPYWLPLGSRRSAARRATASAP